MSSTPPPSSSAELWEPLPDQSKWIRVLELLPSAPDSPIEIRLHDRTLLEGHLPYEAISYTWGEAHLKAEILLNGKGRRIMHNLWTGLRRFRYTDRSRYLWADALCINQTDLTEKGRQVSIIGQIFREADRVLVWLGDVTNGNDDFMREAIKDPWPLITGIKLTWRSSLHERRVIADQILDCPYWSRTWIVQELLHSRSVLVYYGKCEARWKPFRVFIFGYSTASHPARTILVDVAMRRLAWRNYFARKITCAYSVNLSAFQHTQCSDPRDKVYALMPMSAVPYGKGTLAIDYNVDLLELYCRTREVYTLPVYEVTLEPELREMFGLEEEQIEMYLKARGGLQLQKTSAFQKTGLLTQYAIGVVYTGFAVVIELAHSFT